MESMNVVLNVLLVLKNTTWTWYQMYCRIPTEQRSELTTSWFALLRRSSR